MKLGRFLLASIFAGESSGQGADLAQLAASFSPEQLAALQRNGSNLRLFYFFFIYLFFL